MKTIPLTRGYFAIVDDVDYEHLSKHKWCVSRGGGGSIYAVRTIRVCGKNKTVRMHRTILRTETGRYVDHRDGNGLNNTRANLRLATTSQNAWNGKHRRGISGLKGAAFHKRTKKWVVQIRANGRRHYLGAFSTPQEAHAAYRAGAIRLHGEFATFH